MVEDLKKLEKFFLTRSYAPSLLPFESILELPREEALGMPDAFARKESDRGKGHAAYYDHRVEVEDWLRREAGAAGVVMRRRHPLYFRLVKTRREETRPGIVPHHLSLPVTAVDLTCCSFTVGDSFCNYRFVETGGADWYSATMSRHDFLGRVMRLTDAEAALAGYAMLGEERDDYVEVQMWGRP